MPEGDSIHRVAQRLQTLVGEQLEVETPHPRARVTGVAGRLDGRRLLGVEAVGKNLLLRFEDGLVLRSHLRMKGRWQVIERNGTSTRRGMPWLVLRGASAEAILWHGPVLELDDTQRPQARAGHPRRPAATSTRWSSGCAPRIRALAIGEAVLDQRLVAGIGNMWRAEALWRAQVSPWARLGDVSDDELRARPHRGRAAHAPIARLGPPPARRLPPGRPPVSPLRNAHHLARTGRREPHRVLVPRRAREERPRAPCK